MYLKILKKDLKRKKTMNVILLVFIMLATMFVAGSVNIMITVMNGTNYFFKEAGLGDYMIFTLRSGTQADELNNDRIDKFLKENQYTDSYSSDDIMYMYKKNIVVSDKDETKLDNTVILSECNIKQQKFFDSNNNQIKDMKDGTIYLPLSFMTQNNLKPDDMITIKTDNGYDKQFKIIGYFKDAFLGSDLMGTHRFIISNTDFKNVEQQSGLARGNLYSVVTNNLDKFQTDYNNIGANQIFSGNKSLVKTTYIMDMVIAAILLMVSLCLIIISGVMLKFIITFTVNEDYKEIGIMKAIGLQNSAIRKLYTVKYLVLAVTGAVLGFIGSVPFSHKMLMQVTQNMLIKDGQTSLLLQIFISIFMAFFIAALAYKCTGKLKKMSPMDAIRNGNSGERFKRKGLISLRKTRMKATTFLAFNDVINELKKYIPLFFTGVIGILLIAMPVNTINTLNSTSITRWLSIIQSDMCIADESMIDERIVNGSDENTFKQLNDIKENLENHGIKVDRVFSEVMFRYKVKKQDKNVSTIAFRGYNTSPDEYSYDEGTAPKYENEIALSYVTSQNIDACIGDTITIRMFGEDKEFIVTALYQSMNNMGEGMRFSDKTQMDYQAVAGGFGIQVDFDKGLTDKDKSGQLEKCKSLYSNVETIKEYISSILGSVSDRLESLKVIILFVVIIIITLVAVLMQKMFLIRERGQIAMMKSVGFTNTSIIFWQIKRVAVVLLSGVAVGIITSTPFSSLTSGQVFKIMGASKIDFAINPFEVYFMYPFIVCAATLAICVLTMLKVRKISIHDMNNIE